MLSLRILLSVMLGLSINTSIASESDESPSAVYFQGKQSIVIARKKDSRQRGECGISPNVWTLNLCESNTFCYVAKEKVSFWLPDEQRSKITVRVIIENTETQVKAELNWEASEPILAWPTKKMPLSSEVDFFSIELKKRRSSTLHKEIILYKIPVALQTNAEKANWMAQKGCVSQAKMLIEEQTS
ncbi:hypothetical protein [Candidatus Parabeggiatoa sp. HSG14]|uniref:hypothetical protein n=1 Tax=Candidatus Parabeggiatoa sp. HSG14 TaxID=3055593 RepID=UPI0025A6A74E|nr:hypothetical protein [Thiotrichales bacterium HSG14]